MFNFARVKTKKMQRGGPLLLALVMTLMSGTLAAQDEGQDPWEGFNRSIFNFNEGLDGYIAKPLAKGYRAITPDPVENSVNNLFDNLLEVRNVLNDLLQGKPGQALHDGGRFLINSTLGLIGLFDVAGKMGLSQSEGEDFGQTLAVWGVAQGPYVVLPLFGPSSIRGTIGMPVDSYSDPITYIDHVPTRNSVWFANLVALRADLLDIEALVSGDKYVFYREAYLQRREYLINDGAVEDDFFDDFEDDDY